MNRLEKKLKALKEQKKKAFVAFVTAGDPNLKTSLQTAKTLESAGVDILELGMPFSDPMADGPVIQKSSERALRSGTSLKQILEMVSLFRQESDLPIL
ncbi:MAG: tryptophan synthase subunit alpha, partial [Deltaproteobacteria bacterium]|nr:tryptophan synthase subunit alpha [Deltaproteobacteria bacterium]